MSSTSVRSRSVSARGRLAVVAAVAGVDEHDIARLDLLGRRREVLSRVTVVDVALVEIEADSLPDQAADIDLLERGARLPAVDRRVHVRADVVGQRDVAEGAV